MTAVTSQASAEEERAKRLDLSWASLVVAAIAAGCFSAAVVARAEQMTLSESELTCLALNVYHEARNQPLEGQLAVAFVTLNRVDASGRTICQTVYHGWAFSWTRDPRKRQPPADQQAWSLAQGVARWALADRDADPVGGSTFFHAVSVSPEWATAMIRVRQIGDHVFYREAAENREKSFAALPTATRNESP